MSWTYCCSYRDDEKWRHIREHFLRSLNKEKSGDPLPSKYEEYVYADALSFLVNFYLIYLLISINYVQSNKLAYIMKLSPSETTRLGVSQRSLLDFSLLSGHVS